MNLLTVLDELFTEAQNDKELSIAKGPICERIEFVSNCLANRAGVAKS